MGISLFLFVFGCLVVLYLIPYSILFFLHPFSGVPYTDFKHFINQYILSTWQDDWNGAVVNKLRSVKPVLGDWQTSYRRCRKEEIVLHRSYTFDPFIHLEERSSTSV